MAQAADAGARLALAVRQSRGDDLSTRAGAGFFYRLVRALGLRTMPEQGFDAFLMDRDLMSIILEMRDSEHSARRNHRVARLPLR